jgi:hypothetical protein
LVPASGAVDTLWKQISGKPRSFEMNYEKICNSLTHDRPAQGHRHLSRRFFIAEIVVVLLGLVLFLQACNASEAVKESETVPMTTMNSVPYTARPPIDALAPVKTETATFALG